MEIARKKYIGKRIDDLPVEEREHFMKCFMCGGWIDCRDLAHVFEHEGPLPHPAEDKPQ